MKMSNVTQKEYLIKQFDVLKRNVKENGFEIAEIIGRMFKVDITEI